MLNGLGRPEEIARARAAGGRRHGRGEAPYSRRRPVEAPRRSRRWCEAAESALGSVDILVNNAGIQHVAPIDEFPDAKWDAIIAINFSSNFHAIKAALPGMKRRGWGRIINIASAHGLVASPFKSAYVSAKHAVVGLTKTVALEIARTPHHLQRHLPGLRAHAAGRGAGRSRWPRSTASPRRRRSPTCCWRSSPPSAGSRWRMWRAWRSTSRAPAAAR